MCTTGCVRFLLIGLNVIFVILGIAVVGAGLYAKTNKDGLAARFSHIPQEIKTGVNVVNVPRLVGLAATALIVGGIFVMVMGFMGCCGAWKQVSGFLLTYSCIIGILIIIEVAFIGILFVAKGKIKSGLLKFLNVTIVEGYKGGTQFMNNGTFRLTGDAMTLAWDITQFKLECCGVRGFKDYEKTKKWNRTIWIKNAEIQAVIPMACCKLKDPKDYPKEMKVEAFENLNHCLSSPNNETNVNGKGCYEAVKDRFMKYALFSGYMAILIAIMEVGGVICACWLYNKVKD